MGRIFVIIGKSASGKDRIYKELMTASEFAFEKLILYTTRPMRQAEKNGREYFFTTIENMERLESEEKIIEKRVYHTVFGDWYYFTADEGQINPDLDYLAIGTLESYVKLKKYFGSERVKPLYIECGDKTRLLRAINRESSQAEPSYKEVCRRYIADEQDFSEDNIRKAGIAKRFDNSGEIDVCFSEITKYIRSL